jgi:AraC family transcriptional regulator
MNDVVERAIRRMQDQLGEPVTVDDLAKTVNFSKFHFTRIFQRATGISPRRFLSAMRLEEAKRLLITTSLNVANISHQVGYTSVGTFTTRFTASVGLSPTVYRRLHGRAPSIDEDDSYPRGLAAVPSATVAVGMSPPLRGNVGLTFVGLFASRVPEGRPVRCRILSRPGPCRLDNVPLGQWHVLVAAVDDRRMPLIDASEVAGRPQYVAAHGPLDVRAGSAPVAVDLQLRPRRLTDPPVILALLAAQERAQERVPMPRSA